jgi:hypothetical protein
MITHYPPYKSIGLYLSYTFSIDGSVKFRTSGSAHIFFSEPEHTSMHFALRDVIRETNSWSDAIKTSDLNTSRAKLD